MKLLTFCMVIWGALASAASAQSLIASGGYIDFASSDGEDTAVFELEYAGAPVWNVLNFDIGWTVLGRLDGELGVYAGAGLLGTLDFSEKWFLELSLMPGLYAEQTSGNDLGSALEFRSMIGIGRRISDSRAVSIALSHMSNAGIDDDNPGADAIHLRAHFKF